MESGINNLTRLQSFGDSALCQLSYSLLSKIIPFAKMFFHKEACRTALVNMLLVGGLWFFPKQVGVMVDCSIVSFMINRTMFSELDS